MQLISYKTNINSEVALCQLAQVLDQTVGSTNWQLDLQSLHKKLTVFAYTYIDEEQVLRAIHTAGFSAEILDDYLAIY